MCVGKLNVKEETLTFSGRCIVTLNSRKARDLLLKSDQLNIAKCYNPTDIIYKNFGMPKVRVPKSKHIMYLLIALVGDFFFLTLLKKFIKVEQATAISQVRLFVLSAVSSIICCGFNTLFGIMIRHFARNQSELRDQERLFRERSPTAKRHLHDQHAGHDLLLEHRLLLDHLLWLKYLPSFPTQFPRPGLRRVSSSSSQIPTPAAS